MIWTEEKTWKTESPSNSSFIWDRYGFINNPHRGLDYVKSAIVPHLGGGEVVVNGEVFYQKKKEFEEFNNSSVLLIGGGPSLNSLLLEIMIKLLAVTIILSTSMLLKSQCHLLF